jgi:ankyrin repeat protein
LKVKTAPTSTKGGVVRAATIIIAIGLIWAIHATVSNGPFDHDLCVAVLNGNLAAVRSLLLKGSNPNALGSDGRIDDCCGPINPGTAPILVLAAYKDNVPIAAALLRSGADANKRGDLGLTALMWAHSTAMAKLLLGHGANVNVQDKNGGTALMYAIDDGNTDVALLLLNSGANVNARANIDGKTALMSATTHKNWRVIEALLAKKASINIVDNAGKTALIEASGPEGDASVATYLLKHGARADIVDRSGKTAVDYARWSHPELIPALNRYSRN